MVYRSYGHLLVITGLVVSVGLYMLFLWGYTYLCLVKGHNCGGLITHPDKDNKPSIMWVIPVGGWSTSQYL